MRWRRDRGDDNADLSDEEHAWWSGRDRRKEAMGPPEGMPERRVVELASVAPAAAPAAPPPPPPPPPPPLPSLVAVIAAPAPTPALARQSEPSGSTPTAFPFEAAVASPGQPDDTPAPSPGPGAALDPATDPWHRSTSPQALAAYRALGIDWEATWEEVVEVFRDHAALWHPDRLAGTDPLVQAEGQRRMSEMNRAYAELKRMLRPSHRELFGS